MPSHGRSCGADLLTYLDNVVDIVGIHGPVTSSTVAVSSAPTSRAATLLHKRYGWCHLRGAPIALVNDYGIRVVHSREMHDVMLALCPLLM